jgi:hypothetical protein
MQTSGSHPQMFLCKDPLQLSMNYQILHDGQALLMGRIHLYFLVSRIPVNGQRPKTQLILSVMDCYCCSQQCGGGRMTVINKLQTTWKEAAMA